MSKGPKEIHYNTISCNAMHVEGVKRHSKYAVRAHNFLNIQLIFNPQKVLESWDLVLSNHIMLCMLKHVKGVEGQNNFWPFRNSI